MAITKEFEEVINNNDITFARIMIKDSMLIDTSLQTYEEMISYAEEKIGALYDEHDGETLDYNISEWTTDYMNFQMTSVIYNFSRERLELLKKIVAHLYGKQDENTATENNADASGNQNSCRFNGKQIAGGVIALSGCGTLVGGIVASSVPVAVIGGVALVGGIALIVTSSGKEAE
ncbi:MAG: hypothetical protein IJ416_04440 [Ruminiclostridium sp.]|nr:hypothetical protein [Ruminiclostridium sp.]